MNSPTLLFLGTVFAVPGYIPDDDAADAGGIASGAEPPVIGGITIGPDPEFPPTCTAPVGGGVNGCELPGFGLPWNASMYVDMPAPAIPRYTVISSPTTSS